MASPLSEAETTSLNALLDDGLPQLFVAVHSHRHGLDAHLCAAERVPTGDDDDLDAVVSGAGIDFEPTEVSTSTSCPSMSRSWSL
ncbi:hypothetical protein A3709_20345 [Halioglobus sp. HI00S01]|uniref:hypothetical protein n=1 Tax=Halioglobus sp. HI00S01 TaxID=1822214 RepID=UPI0007C242AE|nr:hypothetical protein [Halioglobus sp. HI00S01]KZX57964.1 hypothetical protein A3709_20345 [Halioglobus sp. HI00S01]